MTYEPASKKWVPLIEYRSPDIDELTGIDPDAVKEAPTPMSEPPAEAAPAKAPVAPAATPKNDKTTPAAKK